MLPNDTDFTIFKAASYQGLNFAYVNGVGQYHTPLDNSANVSLPSLQHHGDNVLPSIVALAQEDLSSPPITAGVFFDVLGRRVMHWQARRSIGVAFGAAILLLAQIGWLIRSDRLPLGGLLWGLMAWIVTIALTGGLAFGLARVMRLAGAIPVQWVAHPRPLEIAFGSLAVAVVLACGISFAGRAGFWGLWAGVWVWWILLALVLSWQMPGLSYVLLIPAAVAAIGALPATVPRNENATASTLAIILPLATAGLVGFAPSMLLYNGLGNPALMIIAVAIALFLTPIAPLCVDLRAASGLRGVALPWIPILAAGLAIFAAIVAPAYSAKAPERVNIEYWQDADSGSSQWIVQPASGRLPEPIRLATSFRQAEHGAFPWDARAAFLADAPRLDLAPPTFTILESAQENGVRTYRALLRSERGAPQAAVLFPPGSDVGSVRMEGEPVQPQSQQVRDVINNGWWAYSCPAMPASGVEISFSLPLGKPVEILAADQTYELPSEGRFLLDSRPLTATPSQEGDVTTITRRVQLLP